MLSETPDVAPAISGLTSLFEDLKSKVRDYRPNDDLAPLAKAFDFATANHKKQLRDSGDPYMMHPLAVATILADMRMDVVGLETGLLHDVVEDTSVTIEDIRKNFWRGGGCLCKRRHQTYQVGFFFR